MDIKNFFRNAGKTMATILFAATMQANKKDINY